MDRDGNPNAKVDKIVNVCYGWDTRYMYGSLEFPVRSPMLGGIFYKNYVNGVRQLHALCGLLCSYNIHLYDFSFPN